MAAKRPEQAFEPLDREAMEKHLRGEQTAGVYPLLSDGTCWFLALDFDDATVDLLSFAVAAILRESVSLARLGFVP
jgi:hypothetical protein